ncbi:Hemin receptor [Usitatibacter palustris]|uniref:Hemin receptor n=2 Tax=Usitatibacter palustris TaxID=2732487 RepID=A0A6M4H527_9PROT|nr:Hemin receptor [Usitatibacter palustris]
MDKILVTSVASRVAEAIEATPATVSVIEREELDRTLSHDLRDALRYEPGVSIENSATRFGLGNIAIRGLDGNRVLMMQDGIRMPDHFRIGSFSNANRNPLDLGLVSRIEILRGPGSALYGSDALAGVVSISTIDPRDVLARGATAAGAIDAGYAQADRSWSELGAGAFRFGGVEALVAASRAEGHERENQGSSDTVGATRTTPNPQDTSSTAMLAKVVVPLDSGRWRFTFDRYERDVATDVRSLNPQSVKTVTLVADDRAERSRFSIDGDAAGPGFVDRLSWLAYRQEAKTTQDTFEERANTTAQCLSANGTVRCRREARFTFGQEETGFTLIGESLAGRHKLVYGVEGARLDTEEKRDGRQVNLNTGSITNVVGTDIFPTRDFPNTQVERVGAFVQDEITLDPVRLIPALRYDRYETKPEPDDLYTASNPGRQVVSLSDDAWSPKLGALWSLTPRTTLSLQLAAGFRAPPYADANVGLSNLPLGYAVIANPDLEPERSRGIEFGVRGRHEALDYSLTAYRTDYHDLIITRAPLPCPGDPRCVPGAPITFQSQNVTKARIEGLEARAEARLAPGWTARAGAAWSRGDDLSKGVPLNAVEPAKMVAGLAWELPTGKWGGELVVTHAAEKSRIDASAGVLVPSPSYTIADLTGFVRLGGQVTVHAGIFNLFDRKYWWWSDMKSVTNPGASFDRYTQPGRNASVLVKWRF